MEPSMGKKKRQEDPNMDKDNDSTESCDDNKNTVVCPHIAKGIDFTKIKRTLIQTGLRRECGQCEKEPEPDMKNGMLEFDDDYEYDVSLWLCLRCGNQACGRTKRKHALDHYNKPHSDCHALCVNTSLWYVWCYACDTHIIPNTKKRLFETVEWLKKQRQETSPPEKSPIALSYYNSTNMEEAPSSNNQVATTLDSSGGVKLDLPRVRGLTNLGNTCFFNAVMQCLAQTPFLQPVLQELSVEGEYFELPGGKLKIDETDKDLPLMKGVLSAWGPLTEELCTTLKELNTGRIDVYNPRTLLRQLTQRQPIFAGGDQHDSHELLRNLLEVVRMEDLRRYQSVILQKLGFSSKTNPNSVEGCTKQIIKFYGQQADLMIRTDLVFRGVLVSTLQCQDCKHSSHRDEFFLDLSLPVTADKQMPPSLRRKSDEVVTEPEKPSKYQLKKEKRAARKARKHQHKSIASNSTITEEQPSVENKSESEESDADIEDNIEDCKSPGGCEDPGKGLESGYNSEKISDASPELNMLEIDSGVTSPLTLNVPSPMCAEPIDSPNSGSSDVNIELPSPQLSAMSPEFYERPISRLSFADKSVEPMIEDKLDDQSQSLLSSGSNLSSTWSGTVSARYQCDEDEWSVQSCLNQFTACELMTGHNRVRCDNCTKNMYGDDNAKAVYTNATKQLLISSPPAVLILHLKRFQVSRCFPRKLCKHVTFPMVLDMAPFCSNRCRDLPSIAGQQNKLLYALYGIVEHSGTLHGGHYVAYVKVRPDVPIDNYRWQFLSKSNPAGGAANKMIVNEGGAQGDPAPPPGKWYYVSDSYVAEVAENKVLKAQAYLLFYERIL